MSKFIKDFYNGFFNLKSTLFIGLAYTNYEVDGYENIYCLLEEGSDYLHFTAFSPTKPAWGSEYVLGYLKFPKFTYTVEELNDEDLLEFARECYYEAKYNYYTETKEKVFAFLQKQLESYNYYLIGQYLVNLDNVSSIYMGDPIESDPKNTTLEISWAEPECVDLHILISVEDAEKTLQDLETKLGELPNLDITPLIAFDV